MSHSEQINEIAAALAAAQLEMTSASKNCTNPHFKTRYADINDFLLAVRPQLGKHGIALSQMPDMTPEGLVLQTMLIHKDSGQWLKSTMPINLKSDGRGNEMQALGSCLTYLRRFCLSAIVGIASDVDMDDDGNGSGSYDPRPITAKPAPSQSTVKMVTASQVQHLEAKMAECSDEFKKSIADWMAKNNLKSYSDFSEHTFMSVFQGAIEDQKKHAKELAQ